ncbi:hypothetical protein PINS_up013721 [Pythium insidiosum]|nr:hypothetical protein PINS_up013721 [Pythium insidiosum]
MELPTATRETSDAHSASASASPLLKRLVAGGLLVAGSAALALGLYGHQSATFHADTGRLLQEIASAKGLQVTFSSRNNATDTPPSVHGILFPRPTPSGQLEFDGRLSYDFQGVQYNFTLLDRRAYVTEEQLETGQLTRLDCLHPGNIPPVALLSTALKSARVIDALANPQFSGVTCPSGQLLEFEFVGEPYVLCAKPGAGATAVHGEDISASIELLSENSEGVPSLASLAPPKQLSLSKCDAIPAADAALSRRARRLQDTLASVSQRAQDVVQVATGGRRLGLLGAAPECSCTRGRKQCLFVHGLGYEAGETTDSFEYFGKIHEQVKCCDRVQFRAPRHDQQRVVLGRADQQVVRRGGRHHARQGPPAAREPRAHHALDGQPHHGGGNPQQQVRARARVVHVDLACRPDEGQHDRDDGRLGHGQALARDQDALVHQRPEHGA